MRGEASWEQNLVFSTCKGLSARSRGVEVSKCRGVEVAGGRGGGVAGW